MNIHEIRRRTSLSLSALRKLERLGVLKVDKENELIGQLRFHLGRNPSLTLAQTLALIEEPDLVADLGAYEARVQAQLDALGKLEPAPLEVAAEIPLAYAGDANAAAVVAAWLRSVLTREPVPYLWVAVRLVLGAPAGLRSSYAAKVSKALSFVRAREDFAGWSHKEIVKGRSTVFYHRPPAKPLDL